MDKVLEAERQCRKATFNAMLPFLLAHIDNARDFVDDFCAKHHVPEYEMVSKHEQYLGLDPKTVYTFKLKVSSKLIFTVSTEIYLAQDGELYSYVIVDLCMYNVAFDGCIFMKNEDYKDYEQNVKDACQACLDKYNELHEKLRDYFF